MKRMINILAIVLLLQLALFFGFRMTEVDTSEFRSNERLLAFSPEQVDQLLIEDGEQQKLLLKKTEDQWVLPDYDNAVVDAEKVASQLNTLTSIKRTWPVAQTTEAVKRFKVADDDFEKRLAFKAGDQELATLLLGSSPGFKKVHSRLQAEDQVFDIPYSTYQASLKTADWINKQVLHLDSKQIAVIELPDVTLQHDGADLLVPDLAENEQLDHDQAKKLLEKISKLDVVDIEPNASLPEAESDLLSINVTLSDGNSRQYHFSKQDDRSLLKVSGVEQTYKISGSSFDEMKKANRESLINVVESSEEDSEKESS